MVTLILLVKPRARIILISRWAERQDLRKVQIGLVVMSVLGIAPLVVRIFEFPALQRQLGQQCLWLRRLDCCSACIPPTSSPISIDTLVLAALMFTRHGDNPRRFGDVQDNAMYWNFVVVAWLPIYGCIYWIPRL